MSRGQVLHVYVDHDTYRRLEAFAASSGRTIEELAESAVANEASKVAAPTEPDWEPRLDEFARSRGSFTTSEALEAIGLSDDHRSRVKARLSELGFQAHAVRRPYANETRREWTRRERV